MPKSPPTPPIQCRERSACRRGALPIVVAVAQPTAAAPSPLPTSAVCFSSLDYRPLPCPPVHAKCSNGRVYFGGKRHRFTSDQARKARARSSASFTREAAVELGRKGGQKIAQDRAHMVKIGRAGGRAGCEDKPPGRRYRKRRPVVASSETHAPAVHTDGFLGRSGERSGERSGRR